MSANERPPATHRRPARRRALAWLAWWVLMMGLWTAVDDSIQFDELLAGAGAAALAALGAELAFYQASIRLGTGRAGPLVQEALQLPARLASDTVAVFAALFRREVPRGEYAEIDVPALSGPSGPAGEAGQFLLAGIRSFTPNSFVVSMAPDRQSMLVHRLVAPRESRPGGKS